MAKAFPKGIPTLAARPFEDGSGWYVEAKWEGEGTEKLGRFDNYAETRRWIALEAVAYFVLLEIGMPSALP